MTAIEPHPRGLGHPDPGVDLHAVLVDGAVDESEILQHEVERLQKRVEDLEMTVDEYRTQMSRVLGSASWRLTSPVRASASRWRTAKVRAKRRIKRLKEKPQGLRQPATSGLVPPPLEMLPLTSPLRRNVDPSALRVPAGIARAEKRSPGGPRVAVVAHVHYPDLWGDIDDRLARMPEPFDLIVTVTEGPGQAVVPSIMRRYPGAHIEVVANKGRDWAPLIHLVNEGLLTGYEAIAKVHTKKSEHRIDGDGWRLALLDGVFESPDQIRRILELLRRDRTVGLVVPTGHVAGSEHWGSDQPLVEMLASRLPMAFHPEDLQFPAGSMFWCRPWLLERLGDLDLHSEHFEPEAGQYDATTAHALERLVGIFCHVARMDVVEAMDVGVRVKDLEPPPKLAPRVLAFFLPQFHAIPENDRFWGEGFTDWVNVDKARPLFEGHRQPLQPSPEIGHYDLSDPEVLRTQARLARANGIEGFVFHHYWFDGTKVLQTPLENWLSDPSIDLPLALCWANEPWTRRWDGLEQDVLIPQHLTEGWADRFYDDISPALADPRYIRVGGAPLLIVYRMGLLPDPAAAVARWRARAEDDGLGALHIMAVLPSRDFESQSALPMHAIDGLLSFPPGSGIRLEAPGPKLHGLLRKAPGQAYLLDPAFSHLMDPEVGGMKPAPTVMPGWDNTARRPESPYYFLGSNPVTWAGILRDRLPAVMSRPDRLLFVNAWNEWAEGAALEPSLRFGDAYLGTLIECIGKR